MSMFPFMFPFSVLLFLHFLTLIPENEKNAETAPDLSCLLTLKDSSSDLKGVFTPPNISLKPFLRRNVFRAELTHYICPQSRRLVVAGMGAELAVSGTSFIWLEACLCFAGRCF